MGIWEWLVFSIVGGIIDVLLVTIFYHKRHNVKHYILMVIFMVFASIGINLIFRNEFTKLATTVLIMLIFYLFTKSKNIIAYFISGYLIIALLEYPVIQISALDFYKCFFILAICKIFIISRAKEYSFIVTTGKFLSITVKNIAIICVFIIIAMSFYSSIAWRWIGWGGH